MSVFQKHIHQVEFCVVGGGFAGICAAVSAARHGHHVALVQDRPMLGGNASSEIRMWICGAHGKNNRETGIIEEIELNNFYRNPYKNYNIWDGILLETVKNEPNIALFLNCTCMDGEMDGNRLNRIICWQMTTQEYHIFEADLFADCSGDSILAPITGAEYRVGRESRSEFGEDIAPEQADLHTMGLSCMIQAREYQEERTFIAPEWAKKITADDLPFRTPNLQNWHENFWYLELGGMVDSIHDTELLRDELLRIAYGIWDYLKNDPEQKEKNKNFDIDWIGILPGKRESRRYVGDHILTQSDVQSGGHFDDIIAYGGWTIDDHHPGGFYTKEPPTIHHPAPSPFGIPYRCVYSKNIANLFFAGRNISVTHTAMSSSRVMATCALLGQAVGTAAAVALDHHELPREVGQNHIALVQAMLQRDDAWLPFRARAISPLTASATLVSDLQNAERLRDGYDRVIGEEDHAAVGVAGNFAEYRFAQPTAVKEIRLVFDSNLDRDTLPFPESEIRTPMRHNILLCWQKSHMPTTVTKGYTVTLTLANGETVTHTEENNHQRMVKLKGADEVVAVRLTLGETWGAAENRVFAFDVYEDRSRI